VGRGLRLAFSPVNDNLALSCMDENIGEVKYQYQFNVV